MRPNCKLMLGLGLALSLLTAPGAAQNQSAEFIESSSPLPGGGRVISRSTAGGAMQTVTSSTANSSAARVASNRLSAPRESVLRAPLQNSQPSAYNDNSARYPYPTAQRPASNFVLHPPVRASANLGNRQIPYQIPTLGLTQPTRSLRPQNNLGLCGPCTPRPFGATTAFQVPALQTPATQVPGLSVVDPAQATPFSQSNPSTQPQFFSNPAVPGGGFTGAQNRWWTPFVTGSGTYQPVVRLANVPPGTYLGQGIIGQPKAYVDGQPVRNLFRYVFP